MKCSNELKQERSDVIAQLENIKDVATTEERDLTTEENDQVDGLLEEADTLSAKIERAEKIEANLRNAAKVSGQVVENPSNAKESTEKYSFFKHVRGVLGGNLDGIEAEMQQEAVNESRSFGKSINGIGIPSMMLEKRADITSNIAGTSVGAYVDALREESVYDRVGATILTGLSSDARIPVTGSQSVAWASAENSQASDGGAAFSSVTLTPSRITSKVNLSRELLAQNGGGAESAVMRDLGRATAQTLDAAIFSTAAVSNAPTSVGATSGVNTFTEATFTSGSSVLSDLIEAEQTNALAYAMTGNLAYVCSPELLSQLKISAQVASVTPAMTGMNYNQQMINGYPIMFTNGCTKSAGTSGDGYFGDWSKLYVGFFGGIDITVDPYTLADYNQIRLVLNNLVDFKLAQGAAVTKFTSLVA
jgi:hypothetical protein